MRTQADNSVDIKKYIHALFEHWGRDYSRCELCGEAIPEGKADLHHSKYDGATIYDIKIVCRKCNLRPENVGLD